LWLGHPAQASRYAMFDRYSDRNKQERSVAKQNASLLLIARSTGQRRGVPQLTGKDARATKKRAAQQRNRDVISPRFLKRPRQLQTIGAVAIIRAIGSQP
jgi:hypothetical protein